MYARKNFKWAELECKCGCGTAYISASALDKLQALRDLLGKPLRLNSAARCVDHNRAEGGKDNSFHISSDDQQSCAFDIDLEGHDKRALIAAAERVGFLGIGVNYATFVHVDDRGYYARW